MKKTNRLVQLLILAILVLILPAAPASAMLAKCRTDPHFMLSNGDVITVTLEVGTDIANMKSINYVLHVPAAVTVTKVTYTAKTDNKTVAETHKVYQDSPAGIYTTETVVTTRTPQLVEVTVFARANVVKEISVSGYSGQPVVIVLNSKH